jgi:hypothetical protein
MMLAKTWARAVSVFAHPVDSKADAVTHNLLTRLQSMKIDVGDLDLDTPADAFEALRRIASESPVMHGEAPNLPRHA